MRWATGRRIAAGALALVAAGGTAGPTLDLGPSTYRVVGLEQPPATSTRGTFDGIVSAAGGRTLGYWTATVEHGPLCPRAGAAAAILGGTVTVSVVDGAQTRLTLATTEGSGRWDCRGDATASFGVRTVATGAGCTDQRYRVQDRLGAGGAPGGPEVGFLSVTLTHLRVGLLGRCLTYGATVVGTLRLATPLGGRAAGGARLAHGRRPAGTTRPAPTEGALVAKATDG